MIDRRTSLRLILLGAAGAGLAGCGGGATSGTGEAAGTVLGTLRANGLTRFLAAIEDAGLAATLAGDGPWTVFAPTNRAMAAADLPEDTEALRRLVAFHIVPGMFTTDFLAGVDVDYDTLDGRRLNVDGTAGLRVEGAAIVIPDLGADNGVVNVVDRVLAPR
ncbi:MAG TPA: fasciclin domain-containing protein [Amaricoccus sp.]|nr:fasciclin domain-containing protein [Amaricoccus sp.]